MNKTLLLIICDFLLLNLLALTRWERVEPPRATQPPVPELAANAVTKDQDLVETMRQSLADERTQRDEVAQKLAATDASLAAREQSLNQLQTEKTKLTTALNDTQRTAADLGRRVSLVAQEAALSKEQLAQLQRELDEKRAEAERQRASIAQLEKQQTEARRQIEGLTVAVVVAEQEKKTLREQTDSLKTQVEVERTERQKVQETTVRLAEGVGQLAENSGQLSKEIRDNRPINANTLYNDFVAGRVNTVFTAERKGLFSPNVRTKEAHTVFVTDGAQVFALLHVEDTVFSFLEIGSDWEKLAVQFSRPPSYQTTGTELRFLTTDPRLVAIPVNPAQVASIGAKVYSIAANPVKFPEALLINVAGKGYGEVGFKLDPARPDYVRVDNRFFKRLFGDFAPSRGDLVFTQTGEFLGVMVNRDYCALVKNFTAVATLRAGPDIFAQKTSAMLDGLGARMRALPLELQ